MDDARRAHLNATRCALTREAEDEAEAAEVLNSAHTANTSALTLINPRLLDCTIAPTRVTSYTRTTALTIHLRSPLCCMR